MKITAADPNSGETANYLRGAFVIAFPTNSGTWRWQAEGGTTIVAGTEAQLIAATESGDVPISGWTMVNASAFTFAWTAADGKYVTKFAFRGPGAAGLGAYEVPFIVNGSGQALADKGAWTTTTRLERGGPGTTSALVKVPFAPKNPKRYTLKATTFAADPWTDTRDVEGLYAIRIAHNARNGLMRRWAVVPVRNAAGNIVAGQNDTVIDANQKYLHFDATSSGNSAYIPGTDPPTQPVHDGQRGIGTHGYVSDAILRDDLRGYWWFETNGRLGFTPFRNFTAPAGADMSTTTLAGKSMDIGTLAGWVAKDPLVGPASGAVAGINKFMSTPAEQTETLAWYRSHYKMAGDWSRVVGNHYVLESWGGDVLFQESDGRINPNDGNEGNWCDTLGHRLLYWNAWPAHGVHYRLSKHHPAGYVPPAAATGQVQLFHGLGNTNGTASDMCNEPWKSRIRAQDGKRYWNNHANGTWWRCNPDYSNPEIVFRSWAVPTLAQLNVPGRLLPPIGNSSAVAGIRSSWHRDGISGVGSSIRSQGWDFDSAGNIIFGDYYVFAIRKLTIPPSGLGSVSTIKLLDPAFLTLGQGSSYTHEMTIAVNSDGTCGPMDCITLTMWHGNFGKMRFLPDGTSLNPFLDHPGAAGDAVMASGRAQYVSTPGYGWAITQLGGLILVFGNDGGSGAVAYRKLKATDPACDIAKYKRGADAYRASPMYLTHGLMLQGMLGYPTVEEMGEMHANGTLDAYLIAQGIPAGSVGDVAYVIERETETIDYTAAPIPDPPPPDPDPPPTLTLEQRVTLLETRVTALEG